MHLVPSSAATHFPGQCLRLRVLTYCFRQYHWQDEKGKKLKQSAPQYIDHMMSYVQKSVTDESQFPTKFGEC